MSLYENVKEEIIQQLREAVRKAEVGRELSISELPAFVLEEPREKQHGDLATNLAMLLTKQAKQPPREIAAKIIKNIDLTKTWIASCEIAGPGFINFRLNPQWLAGVIPQVLSLGGQYGASTVGKGQKVQVEFVSANPTGLLHMGNARGAALGDSLASLLAMAGYEVSREFYINDAGNQIHNFALSLEARYLQQFGQEVDFPENGYHGQDLIDTVLGIIAQDGSQYLDLPPEQRQEHMVRHALQEKIQSIQETLGDFGVKYDVWFSELSLHEGGEVAETIAELKRKEMAYVKDEALWLKSTSAGEEKDEVLIRGNGIPTYFAADIAYHRNKFQRGFHKVINIWGADHHGHVARMKGAMEALGYDPNALQVILMQLVRLIQEGEVVKMSKRSGQYITLRELMDEVGRDAARFFFIMRDPDSTVEFDLDLAKSQSADNPVFYVQYAHARLCSILRQAKEQGFAIDHSPSPEQLYQLASEEEKELLQKMAELPGEIALAARLTEPHRLARYVLDLASLFHSFYNSQRVLVAEEDLRIARLGLVRATRQVIANVLRILGVSAPEKM